EPLTMGQVQGLLRTNEVLLVFMDTTEGTFIFAVTKTQARWVHSDLGTAALADAVAALRCGLDQASWEDEASRCRSLTQSSWTGVEPLPFNLGRAHDLYKALFGNIEDLIKDKQLLIVPSGPLTRLPFQVLVTAKPTADLPQKAAGYAEAAWLIKEHAVSI